MRPLRAGLALAATVALFYVLCTLIWLVAPGPFVSFMNSLFHGVDFGRLVRTSAFDPAGFCVVLIVLSAWAFLGGAFFGWLYRRLAPEPTR